MMDKIVYTIEELHEMIEFSVMSDREYFLERRGEIIVELETLIERVRDE